ncbi:alpha-(1,3)-fucosyltransferase C-like [Daphnia magna]|uniref:alpha-(1,3)-fucosyltransferase C-like n=1 Tax=Daphnia magna TaxID=35525 RepID=UPI001E1BBE5B|nr:alpha-(1,3)-fucosyltransferase C-like [Daphnia magna]
MNILRFYLLNISVVLLEASFLATGLLHEKDNCPSSNQIDSAQVDRDSDLVTKNEPSSIEADHSNSKPKIILFWNTFHNQTDMMFGFGQQPFIDAGCQITNCLTTDDRSLFSQSDGVVIHAGDYEERDLPTDRSPDQTFIFLNQDPLANESRLPCFSHPHFYNWTMTHRRDSDVYFGTPYAAIRRRENTEISNLISSRQHCFQLANRKKLIVWFNSRCSTQSQREHYVKQLAEFIPVDIYGKCGALECLPRNDPHCETRLLAHYKFYLAAEDSLCPDYITEHFYHALMNNIVPVVYGGADYTQFAPLNSYINVADFKSAKDLAEYLMLLHNNDALYRKHFDWKQDYELIRKPSNGWCNLCQKLNDPARVRKSYQDLFQWWNEQVPCWPGSSYLATIQS